MYDIVSVVPANGGFGEWQVAGARTGAPVTLTEYKKGSIGMGCKLYELGKDKLPPGAEDIRGAIQSEPDRVFCYVNQDKTISYCGANAI